MYKSTVWQLNLVWISLSISSWDIIEIWNCTQKEKLLFLLKEKGVKHTFHIKKLIMFMPMIASVCDDSPN